MKKQKSQKITLLDRKTYQSREEFAESLELIAKRLKEDKTVTFKEGDKETIIAPNSNVKAEYKYEKRDGRHKFEIELKWDEEEKPTLSIE